MKWLGIGFLLVYLLSGCSNPQYQSGLSAKESRMSEELLRSQVLRYKEEFEKYTKEIDRLSKECPEYDEYRSGSPNDRTTPDWFDIMVKCPEFYETMTQWGESWSKHFLFYDKLKEKGGDISGLEIDFYTPIQEKYYSPPIEEPDIPAPDTKNRATV